MAGAVLVADERAARRAAEPGRRTLEAVVAGVWEELATPPHAAACPVCAGPLTARFGSGARPVGGVCRGCGSELS